MRLEQRNKYWRQTKKSKKSLKKILKDLTNLILHNYNKTNKNLTIVFLFVCQEFHLFKMNFKV